MVPQVKDFVYISDKAYTQEEIIQVSFVADLAYPCWLAQYL